MIRIRLEIKEMDAQQFVDKGTEKFAIDEEIRLAERKIETDEYIKVIAPKITKLLSKHDADSKYELLKIFADKRFQDICLQINQFSILFMLMDIYSTERDSNVKNNVLDSGKNEDELRKNFWKIKRLLIRHELAKDDEAAEILIDFIECKNISGYALAKMITWCNYDRQGELLTIAFKCIEHRMISHALILLKTGNGMFPEIEQFVISLAQLYHALGEKKAAIKILESYKYQTESVKMLVMELQNE